VCSVSLLPEDCSFSYFFYITKKTPAVRQTYEAFAQVLIGFRRQTMPSG